MVRHGGLGLVHGNGGQATKRSFGIYGPTPPRAFAKVDAQDTVDLDPREQLPQGWAAEVTIEAATLVYDSTGPSHVFAAVLDAAGRRGRATSRVGALSDELATEGLAGRQGRRTRNGELVV